MSETPPDAAIDVVVPVHGGWRHVEACLAALESQTVPVNVIVVDDLSPDDTLQRIRERFASFTILANEKNLGFAATCNRGIRAGTGEFVVLLNSDVVARPDLAENLRDRFASAPARTGSVAPILLGPDGSVDSFGITADVTLAGFVRFHGAPLARADAARPPLLGPYGAAAAYRRVALDEVGVLDENIFMYGEELELAYRLRAAGWGAVTLPAVVGTHIGIVWE
jgi:GT2 family glycosyltransferase